MGGRQGGLPLQDNYRSERISVWIRERKRRTNHADSSQNQPRRTWRDSLSDWPTRQTSEEEHRDKKEDTAATGKRHDFLTDKIPPLAPDFWHKDGYDGSPVNLTTPENFDYLYQSASNYTGLMGIKLPFRYRKGGSPRLKITELYKVMEESVPECVNLEEKEGRLHFCLFRHHDWPEPALFWIPIDFTERLPIPLRNIVREFIRQFVRHHGVSNVTEAFCYDFAIEELEDWENRDSDASPKEIRANKRLADSYQSGKRAKALKRMSGKPFCNSLEEAARNYRTKKGRNKNYWN